MRITFFAILLLLRCFISIYYNLRLFFLVPTDATSKERMMTGLTASADEEEEVESNIFPCLVVVAAAAAAAGGGGGGGFGSCGCRL